MGGFLNITCTLCEANSYACISTLLCLQLTRFTPQLSWSDSNGNRTRVTAVKGRCLNRLTMEPYIQFGTTNFCPIKKNSPSRARTYNNSVNSRVLYHWAIEDYFDCFAIIKVCTFKTSYRWSDFLSSFITTYSLCSYVHCHISSKSISSIPLRFISLRFASQIPSRKSLHSCRQACLMQYISVRCFSFPFQ